MHIYASKLKTTTTTTMTEKSNNKKAGTRVRKRHLLSVPRFSVPQHWLIGWLTSSRFPSIPATGNRLLQAVSVIPWLSWGFHCVCYLRAHIARLICSSRAHNGYGGTHVVPAPHWACDCRLPGTKSHRLAGAAVLWTSSSFNSLLVASSHIQMFTKLNKSFIPETTQPPIC